MPSDAERTQKKLRLKDAIKIAIKKLKERGIIFQSTPNMCGVASELIKHNIIEQPNCDNQITKSTAKEILIKIYYQRELLETTKIITKSSTTNKQIAVTKNTTTTRRIKSTLPCPTNSASKIAFNPIGYKQKSKKSETINLDNFYDSWAWKDLRLQALQKYGRRCACCGVSPNSNNKIALHVDHIKPIRKYPKLALDIDNLQVLCQDCNMGKGYWNETDFR